MRRRQRAWIFVSHSTRDIHDVRRVRNEVETHGGEPLLFFLKCVSDNDELDDLLKREIEARRYFLLCDSRNAQGSKWVSEEVAHVRSLGGKRIGQVDLTSDWQHQKAAIRALLRTATLFPVYANQDRGVVDPLLNALGSSEFGMFDAFDRTPRPDELGEAIRGAIDDSRYLLHFLSDYSMRSAWCALEVRYFLESREAERGYIPVLLEDTPAVRDWLREVPFAAIDFTTRDIESFLKSLEDRLYAE